MPVTLASQKLSCLGHLQKLNKLETLKIEDLQLQRGIIKKLPNKAKDTVQLYQLNMSSI